MRIRLSILVLMVSALVLLVTAAAFAGDVMGNVMGN
jgi:hypothetical protein